LGPMGDQVMVITTIGRKSGKTFSTPIGYLYDGETLVALTSGSGSNWYKNLKVNPQARLEIKGKAFTARAEAITAPAEIERVFELYRRERARDFQRYFGIPADAPQEELDRARDSRKFVRFYLD
jgi:deazaflavin-dependent oxidoreductase (nitroreductase family)